MNETITVTIKDEPAELTVLEAITLRNELTRQINIVQEPVAKAVNFFEIDKKEVV